MREKQRERDDREREGTTVEREMMMMMEWKVYSNKLLTIMGGKNDLLLIDKE